MTLVSKDDIREKLYDSTYAARDLARPLPKYAFPEIEHDPKAIMQVVEDELFLDGNPRQNLATFCQTWEEEEVHKIMDFSMDRNMIDKSEYPQTAELEIRCAHMLADLWNAPDAEDTIGTSTTGSSEACMLGGMAAKWRWRAKRQAEGKPIDKPNLVCGPVQVCWEKFCRYWDIEKREVEMTPDRLQMDPASMLELVDENTIAVVPTFGVTYTGHYELVKPLSDALDKLQEEKGLDIDIHVDAASGGFLGPFCAPEIEWDFRLPRVKSISTSGHKYGLAPLGVGWIVWRDKAELPDDLVFSVPYLGGSVGTFAINFSRPAGQIVSQYYLFNRLGRDGYRRVQDASYQVAQFLSSRLEKLGPFDFINTGDPKAGIPAVCFRIRDGADLPYTLYDLSAKLLERGWQVPTFNLSGKASDITIMRVMVRQGVSMDMAQLLVEDIERAIAHFDAHPVTTPLTEEERGSYSHG
ncbi:MAG: glutamate decarboxylase [Marinibacterium profundimaris]